MSHFYGTLKGSRGEASRCGTKKSGVEVVAASWAGAIRVHVFQDDDGNDRFYVAMVPWGGSGDSFEIASGPIGKADEIKLTAIGHLA